MRYVFLCFSLLMMFPSFAQLPVDFDLQGHRGCRSIYPENSIPAFIHAVKLGVTTLELDVLVTKDNKVVVCHDPILNKNICFVDNCKEINKDIEMRIYHLTYEELQKFDCGCKGNPDFPDQKKISVKIPLLSEMIDSVEQYILENKLRKVNYNIEIKSKAENDQILTPSIKEFTGLVYKEISEKEMKDRVFVQSFDVRALQEMKTIDPDIKLALLVSNIKSYKQNIKKLGFNPDIYSPYYKLLNKNIVQKLHASGIRVIPWTVNSKVKIQKLTDMGVDGIITDDPRLLK